MYYWINRVVFEQSTYNALKWKKANKSLKAQVAMGEFATCKNKANMRNELALLANQTDETEESLFIHKQNWFSFHPFKVIISWKIALL